MAQKNNFKKPEDLKIFPGHEGIYHLRDLKYISRVTNKIAGELFSKIEDIDWLQLLIESFLIINSRVYSDLIPDLIRECAKYQTLDIKTIKIKIENFYSGSLSYSYHRNKNIYRHRAVHDSNYLRVGIIEFGNDILPRPINYKQTEELLYMASVKNLIKMWSGDIKQCSEELFTINAKLVELLNEHSTVFNLNYDLAN